MKKIRTFFIRTILGIMAGLFLSAGITATPVQAAFRLQPRHGGTRTSGRQPESVIRKQFECTTTN